MLPFALPTEFLRGFRPRIQMHHSSTLTAPHTSPTSKLRKLLDMLSLLQRLTFSRLWH